MQNNFDTVKETFQQQVKLLTSDIARWTAFLNTVGNNYKYPFNDQIMIFDRKPNAVACATIDFWNKHERYVNKGTKGIPLLDYTKNTLKYVFDVSDTNSKVNKGIYLWQAEEKYYDNILESLEDSFGDLPVHINFFNDIRKITSNIVTDNYGNYFAELSNYNEESFKELCINSVEYIVISRCGENADKYFRNEDFSNISEYNNINAIFTLGEAVSDISEMILRDIEKTVVFEKKLELIAIEKANNLMHNENNKLGGQHYERTNIT